jgi:hypothetical protein
VREVVTFPQIEEILDILDDHDLNRELIVIPLGPKDPGSISRQKDGRVKVVVPESGDFDEWVASIRAELLRFFDVEE